MSESNHLINFATSSELIANGEGRNVLSAIEDGLRNCDEFLISVAFIVYPVVLVYNNIIKFVFFDIIKERSTTCQILSLLKNY